jgi:hypothetical protein
MKRSCPHTQADASWKQKNFLTIFFSFESLTQNRLWHLLKCLSSSAINQLYFILISRSLFLISVYFLISSSTALDVKWMKSYFSRGLKIETEMTDNWKRHHHSFHTISSINKNSSYFFRHSAYETNLRLYLFIHTFLTGVVRQWYLLEFWILYLIHNSYSSLEFQLIHFKMCWT